MPKWRISAFDGAAEDDSLDEVVRGSESQIETLLQRLVASHLSGKEIIEGSDSGAHFKIHRDKRPGEPTRLSTTGTGHHYVAVEERDA